MNAMTAYKALEERFQRMSALSDALSVLHWDAAVIMPRGGAAARADQLAALKVVHHEQLTDPALAGLLDAAEGADLDPWQRANLHAMRRRYDKAAAVPQRLVSAMSKATSSCEHAWRDAKKNGTFADIRPQLAEVIALTVERGQIMADLLDLPLYDAMIDDYEEGARAADIAPVFEDYAAFLPDFLAAVLDRQDRAGPKPEPRGPFPTDRQRALVDDLARTVGFDFDAGRIDVSAHPFSTGYQGDQRITVGYDENDVAMAIMSALHESGHAMYEANLPAAWRGQPVGRARGMALHESQSLLIEMQACRSPEFLSFLAPKLRDAFGEQPAFEDHAFQRLYHWVEPGFIRVEADEVTYPAHVILRFRLEQALLSGDLPLDALPEAWNAGMQELLGITPPSDAKGVLQDIHWYDGAFGYFPTYTLGAMTAAQLFQAARNAIPELGAQLAAGDFAPLRAWLGEAVHGKASSMTSRDIITAATGRPLDPKAFEAHLKARYLAS